MPIPEQLDKIESIRIEYMNGRRRRLVPKEIKKWKQLLTGDPNTGSSGRRSIFRRARKFADAIRNKLGLEVLLLVFSSINRTDLAQLPEKEQLLEALEEWWNRVPHPPKLNDAAKCFAMDNDVERVDTVTPQIMELGKST
jgi:hypothetical protein